MSADGPRFCRECGKPLAAGAAFCRGCGAGIRPPATPPEPPPAAEPPTAPPPSPAPAPKPRRRGRTLLLALAAVLCLGGGAAAAILLLGGDSKEETPTAEARTIPSSTTATTRTEEASAAPTEAAASVGTIGSGRYIQAGSFRTVPGAEAERERLEAVGVRVMVVDSAEASELYPGFQVLLVGPLTKAADERSALKRLHENEVPSAFARTLSPAPEVVGPEAVAGSWAGTLERSGSEDPDRDGPLEVKLNATGDGQEAVLKFEDLNCRLDLELAEATPVTLTYDQEGQCVGGGQWYIRPSGEELSMVLLPPDSEVIILGTLDRD